MKHKLDTIYVSMYKVNNFTDEIKVSLMIMTLTHENVWHSVRPNTNNV